VSVPFDAPESLTLGATGPLSQGPAATVLSRKAMLTGTPKAILNELLAID
jgi:hypothetical protein